MSPIQAMVVPQEWLLPYLALLWTTISSLLSILGGWQELARNFRTRDEDSGEKFHMVSASIGWRFFPVSYGGILTARVSKAGLRLSILFPFRILHPPLFIPWSAVESVKQERFLFRARTRIGIQGFKRHLVLYGGAGKAVAAQYNLKRGIPR